MYPLSYGDIKVITYSCEMTYSFREEQMFRWMQNLGAKMGEPLPQALFLPPRPPEDTPVSTSIPMSTHSHTHSHTHTSTPAHTHTHTHTVVFVVLPFELQCY